ncbi:heterogeneous nuclear ribonucleoprotein C [Diorhabda carinulata]|uniref:heterogeneous nuclear ribonucleoprotein C n=1 Tax=Diorhabda sublineata TaxID=1163346 RepID=UPI0024E059EF|nr:heterogeneous nuclear ribonucleoprotein C [Diorhabda sublineata]XP_057672233.1 heterogeneous nuclear ribonucleoprotein C [Diorhabda carinulata]XP_057672234.1 heterogeneous nuclear ribonucleoprotein C [Diorhabda carinulata]
MDILELNKISAAPKKANQKQSTKMKLSKVGNQTNSQDPQAVNSRLFVGNLNTFQCSKTDVERMFQRYGRLAGISMHKGYAFVQFTNPFDARSACLGEDGRTVLSQILDVNMVAEPKPHQTGRKRQNIAKTGNDWDYYYDSYYASTAFPVGPTRLVPPIKRQRLMTTTRNGKNQSQKTTIIPPLDQLKVYSNQDILICGNCRELFSELQELLEHKKTYCKLRFTCKCDSNKSKSPEDPHASASLLCVQCKDAFQNAWDLMVHAQAAHMLNIYELGIPSMENCSPPTNSPRDNNTPDKDSKSHTGDEEIGNADLETDDHDGEFVENGRDGLTGTPDSNDKELEDLMDVQSAPKTCIMHALSIVSAAPSSQPGSTPPPLAAVAPHTPNGDAWKPHTRLSPKLEQQPY